jgi:hypothetical protein
LINSRKRTYAAAGRREVGIGGVESLNAMHDCMLHQSRNA